MKALKFPNELVHLYVDHSEAVQMRSERLLLCHGHVHMRTLELPTSSRRSTLLETSTNIVCRDRQICPRIYNRPHSRNAMISLTMHFVV
jgi:hypothetical protein